MCVSPLLHASLVIDELMCRMASMIHVVWPGRTGYMEDMHEHVMHCMLCQGQSPQEQRHHMLVVTGLTCYNPTAAPGLHHATLRSRGQAISIAAAYTATTPAGHWDAPYYVSLLGGPHSRHMRREAPGVQNSPGPDRATYDRERHGNGRRTSRHALEGSPGELTGCGMPCALPLNQEHQSGTALGQRINVVCISPNLNQLSSST